MLSGDNDLVSELLVTKCFQPSLEDIVVSKVRRLCRRFIGESINVSFELSKTYRYGSNISGKLITISYHNNFLLSSHRKCAYSKL